MREVSSLRRRGELRAGLTAAILLLVPGLCVGSPEGIGASARTVCWVCKVEPKGTAIGMLHQSCLHEQEAGLT